MDCSEVIDELRAGYTSDNAVKEVEKHAENCVLCREILKQWIHNEIMGLPELPAEKNMEEVKRKIFEKLKSKHKEPDTLLEILSSGKAPRVISTRNQRAKIIPKPEELYLRNLPEKPTSKRAEEPKDLDASFRVETTSAWANAFIPNFKHKNTAMVLLEPLYWQLREFGFPDNFLILLMQSRGEGIYLVTDIQYLEELYKDCKFTIKELFYLTNYIAPEYTTFISSVCRAALREDGDFLSVHLDDNLYSFFTKIDTCHGSAQLYLIEDKLFGETRSYFCFPITLFGETVFVVFQLGRSNEQFISCFEKKKTRDIFGKMVEKAIGAEYTPAEELFAGKEKEVIKESIYTPLRGTSQKILLETANIPSERKKELLAWLSKKYAMSRSSLVIRTSYGVIEFREDEIAKFLSSVSHLPSRQAADLVKADLLDNFEILYDRRIREVIYKPDEVLQKIKMMEWSYSRRAK